MVCLVLYEAVTRAVQSSYFFLALALALAAAADRSRGAGGWMCRTELLFASGGAEREGICRWLNYWRGLTLTLTLPAALVHFSTTCAVASWAWARVASSRTGGPYYLITYGRYETRAEKSPTPRARGGRIAEERSLLETCKRHGVQAAGAHSCTAQHSTGGVPISKTIADNYSISVCSVLCLEAARIPTPTCTARPSPNCTALPGKQLPHFLDCRGERAKNTSYINYQAMQCNATQLSTWIPQSKTAEAQFSKTGQHTKQDGELKHKFILSP
jgi:hypothetical protein